MPDFLWQLESIGRRGRPRDRLTGITAAIPPGITAVVGPSGAGKTTLLNLLIGFEQPDTGRVIAGDTREGELPVYWVPQDGGLWPHLSAREHLAAVAPPPRQNDIDRLLADFGLTERSDARPAELSLGEAARLSVARALISQARILIMDEPLGNVDRARRAACWDALRNELRAGERSLIFATHAPDAVLAEAAWALCLRDGRLIYAGDVQELYHRPATPEQAACLGEYNWFANGDLPAWTGANTGPACVRPEQLEIDPAEAGDMEVVSARFRGMLAETVLRRGPDGEERRFYHRPSGARLKIGMRVMLRILSLLLVLLIGCRNAGPDGPALDIADAVHWNLPAAGSRIPAPRAVASGPNNNSLLVLDTAGRVLIYDGQGKVTRQWSMPDYAAGKAEGVCLLKDGRIAVADTHYHRLTFFTGDGVLAGHLGREGRGPGEFLYPVGIIQDPQGFLYVCEYGSNDRVQKFRPDGTWVLSFGTFGTGPGAFQRASGLVWHAGRVYVADAINSRIQVFTDEGIFERALDLKPAGRSLHFPYDLSLHDGHIFAVEYGACRVTRIRLDGTITGRWGGPGFGLGGLKTPWGIAAADGGFLFIADTGNRRIVRLKL